jgi:hypothetical protein
VARKRQAEEALGRDFQPGERITASSLVTSGLSGRGLAAVLAVCLVQVATSLEILLGPLQPGPFTALAFLASLASVGLCFWFLCRPVYAATTDRRLICCRLSRLRGTPRRPALTVPLADLRIVSYRSGKYATSVLCEFPGRKPVRLQAGREEFAGLDRALAHAGAYAKLDPPYPPAWNLPQAHTSTSKDTGGPGG